MKIKVTQLKDYHTKVCDTSAPMKCDTRIHTYVEPVNSHNRLASCKYFKRDANSTNHHEEPS